MTFLTSNLRMLSLKSVPSSVVIKFVDGPIPVDDGKVFAVVLRVTLHTHPVGLTLSYQGRMQSSLTLEPLTDVAVALNTFELGSSFRAVVAIGTVVGTVQHTVCLRKSAGRNLGQGKSLSPNHK